MKKPDSPAWRYRRAREQAIAARIAWADGRSDLLGRMIREAIGRQEIAEAIGADFCLAPEDAALADVLALGRGLGVIR